MGEIFHQKVKWLTLLLLFLGHLTFSQGACVKKLKKAKKLYEEGNIEEVESLISACLTEGFTKDEEIEAQKLLVLVALFDDDLENADLQMINFLKLYPEYRVVIGKDQREFIKLYDKFKTIPSISVGVSVGTNMSFVEEFTTEGVHPVGNSTSSYKSLFGVNFGLKLNKQFTKHLTFETGLEVNSNSFEYTGKYYENEMLLVANERQTWVGVPAVISYSFLSGKVKPYIGVGASFGYLLAAKGDYTLSYTDEAQRKLPSTNSSTDLTTDYRESINYWGIIAVGTRIKMPRALVSLDITYRRNLKQQNIANNRYLDSETYFNTLYLDDDFYVDNAYFSVSYVYSFYNPKKKRAYSKQEKSLKNGRKDDK